jgi:glutamine amidotransferase-like uncharacterized protein
MLNCNLRQVIAVTSALLAASAGYSTRVALYVGEGATINSYGNYSVALAQLVQDGSIASFTELNSSGIDAGLSGYEVLLVPGGMSTDESLAIGPLGLANIMQFVAGGGGYVGVCAGAYLATTVACCPDDAAAICSPVGCTKTNWSLGLVNFGTASPWARGHGPVNITFSDEAIQMLGLSHEKYSGVNVTITYWQGPIASKMWPNVDYTVLATYRSEIHSGWTNFTTGIMVDTPAIITQTFGNGRVLLSSPHPEETVPVILDLIRGYVLYAAKAI